MFAFILLISVVLVNCQTDDEFAKQLLEEHNKVRQQHHAPPLQLDAELCKDAQVEAERKAKIFAETGSFGPPPSVDAERSYNDNTWAQVSQAKTKLNAVKIVKEWADQAQKHDWSKNYYDTKSGHFTQMVWKSSDELGVGSTTVKNPKKQFVTVVVVRYSPPGNILDEDTFAHNVSPA